MNMGKKQEVIMMYLKRKLMNSKVVPILVMTVAIQCSPFICSASVVNRLTYVKNTDSDVCEQNTLLNKKCVQMEQIINEMVGQLKKYPEDKNLQRRLCKARKLYSNACDYYNYAQNVPEQHLDAPTAGYSALTSTINTSSYWMEAFNQCVEDCLSLDTKADYFYGYYNVDSCRKTLVNAAMSLKGKISYEWGAKPSSKGWNKRWNVAGTGLDCSGFVAWTYWTGLDSDNLDKNLLSTLSISRNIHKISYNELLPGDLGMIIDDGTYYTDINGNRFYSEEEAIESNIEYKEKIETELLHEASEEAKKKGKAFNEEKFVSSVTVNSGIDIKNVTVHSNHVGIYVGKTKSGKDIWCHCKGGSERTVVVDHYPNFKYYYRALEPEKGQRDE